MLALVRGAELLSLTKVGKGLVFNQADPPVTAA
jgi:hypothetical protein